MIPRRGLFDKDFLSVSDIDTLGERFHDRPPKDIIPPVWVLCPFAKKALTKEDFSFEN